MEDQRRTMNWNQNYPGELREELSDVDFHLAQATDTLNAMRERGHLTDRLEQAINHSREAVAALRSTIKEIVDVPSLASLRYQMVIL